MSEEELNKVSSEDEKLTMLEAKEKKQHRKRTGMRLIKTEKYKNSQES